MFFPLLFFPKDFIIPYIIASRTTDFPYHHSIMYDFTPLYSPVICKNFFPFVYMYKSSRYYAVFHIDLGPMFPRSTTLCLEIGSTAAFKLLATIASDFLVLTTKSIHYYPYSYHFHTKFTFIAPRIPPLTLSFNSMPLDPLAPRLTMRLLADAQIPTTQRLTRVDYIIDSHIQAVTGIKYILAVSIIKYLNKFITSLTCHLTLLGYTEVSLILH